MHFRKEGYLDHFPKRCCPRNIYRHKRQRGNPTVVRQPGGDVSYWPDVPEAGAGANASGNAEQLPFDPFTRCTS